ncbi:MAG: hypothetical protein KKA73_29605 [Chloroflexi bacterium]|nr:hypothetical protein [Chloroflexota bacterium]MBU1751854.1 hypothetical protein [Chloroflexota bacterium]MBU1877842.1 hypothetical protein [Chloroflexota bacterium]
MSDQQARLMIVENRGMICDILVDVLQSRGFADVTCVASLEAVQFALNKGERLDLLLVDVGLFGGRDAALTALARIPDFRQRKVVLFSCVDSLQGHGVYLLRSPRDFSAIADVVEVQMAPAREARLGELLVEANLISHSARDAVLAVQAELAKIGRRKPVGQLFVALGFVSQSDVVWALRMQGRPSEDDSI